MTGHECVFSEQMILYSEGMLEGDEKIAFEAHLPGCALCQADLALMGEFEKGMGTEIPLPDDFNCQVMKKIEALTPDYSPAAALAAAAVFMILFFLPGTGSTMSHTGTFLSHAYTFLKNSHFVHLAVELIVQNGSVLILYIVALSVTALMMQLLSRKQALSGIRLI